MNISDQDYAEKVYAGVLGKVIGVYLGRPFEGWSHQRIQSQLGDIESYVHEQLNQPLIVTDDDISGTFTFLRALADHDYDADITARDIGRSWLNYLIEDKTILWWGGLGNSTEHTAYLRLKAGTDAPMSGSAQINGKVVSEQIGAQIFIDGWAMVSPGDPHRAARFAEQAARVSHDGEAVYGAIVLAVMEALAFEVSDSQVLLDEALKFIPGDSVITRLINDVRSWHAGDSDWRRAREKLDATYGYDKYGGNCHMVPNHGLIMLALLHGNDDFAETMKIVNTAGWDTDCNAGNLGCLMGIKNGLAGIDHSPSNSFDWRTPVADRIYVPTADPTWGISDCVREAAEIINTRRRVQGLPGWEPKGGAQFHFEFPGSMQGFTVVSGHATLQNVAGTSVLGTRTLRVNTTETARIGTPLFAPSKEIAKRFEGAGYALLASPRIHPGQQLELTVIGEMSDATAPPRVRPYCAYYGDGDTPTLCWGEEVVLSTTDAETVAMVIPPEAHPVFEVGVEVTAGVVHLDCVRLQGEPDVELTRPPYKGTMWRRAWVGATDEFSSWGEPYRLIQNQGRGLLIQGNRSWRNYSVTADVTPHLADVVGVAARVQGMRRYLALVLRDQQLQLIRVVHEETLLAAIDLPWQLGETYKLELMVNGSLIEGSLNGSACLSAEDKSPGLTTGGIALLVENGRTATQSVTVRGI